MLAVADPDAVFLFLLPHAECGNGSAAGAVAVGARPFGARSVAHYPDCHHHHHAADAAYDAAGGNGSGAAENDERDDAGDVRRDELEYGGWSGLVLVRRSGDRDRAAIGDESNFGGPRDARNDGEAGAEEREMKRSALSRQLSAVSSQLSVRANVRANVRASVRANVRGN